MKAPAFWYKKKSLVSSLWLPVAAIYHLIGSWQRSRIKPVTAQVPVICIGNLVVGGAGKTPVAMHIGRLMKDKDRKAFFLSRGYAGTLTGPLLVDVNRHTANDVGDEPMLLAQILPTIVARDRIAGAALAIKLGADSIIMDDGFQNPSLHKTLSFLVIDGKTGFGNGRLLPAGPLREPVEEGLKRAHAIVIVNRNAATEKLLKTDKPILYANTQLSQEARELKGHKILPFCGIGNPQKFFDSLSVLGGQIAETVAFGDHHLYTADELKKLMQKAVKHDAMLVTTTKDAVRVPPAFLPHITVIKIDLTFEKPAIIESVLDLALKRNAKT